MKKIKVLLVVAVVVVLTVVLYPLFFNGNPRMAKGEKVVERDSNVAYDSIANHGYYYSLAEAIADCDSFLSYFQYRRCALCDDVRAMRQSFVDMREFFCREFCSYEYFRSEGCYMESLVAQSPYQNVKQTWDYLYKEESARRLRAALSGLTAYDFKVYLHDYALQVCQERYRGSGFFTLRLKKVVLDHLTEPVRVEGKAAMECSAVYKVYLEGALGLGLRTRTEMITVAGRLGYTESGKLKFEPSGVEPRV